MSERDLIRTWLLWKERTGGRGISQKDLAEQAGLSPTYLSSIMTGTRNAGTKTIERIAEALGITLAGFYAGPPGHDDPFPEKNEPKSVCSIPDPDGEYPSLPPETPAISRMDPVPEGTAPGDTGWRISSLRADQVDRLFDSFGYSIEDDPIFAPVVSPEPPVSPDHTASTTSEGDIPFLTEVPEGDWRFWPIGAGGRDLLTIPRGLVPARAFGVRMDDDSMVPILERGTLLVVDPGLTAPLDGRPAVATRNGRFLVRRISGSGDRLILAPANPVYSPEIVEMEGTGLFTIVLIIPPGILLM